MKQTTPIASGIAAGTVSDFDNAGGFGLIMADDGGVLPFNLKGIPVALQRHFHSGARVRFTVYASHTGARAGDVVPIDDWNDRGSTEDATPSVRERRQR